MKTRTKFTVIPPIRQKGTMPQVSQIMEQQRQAALKRQRVRTNYIHIIKTVIAGK